MNKNFKSSLKSFGMIPTDELVSKLSDTLELYSSNVLEKISKNNRKNLIVDNKLLSSMKGGRVLLPSEYFGSTTNNYIEKPNNETHLNVTNEIIRPAIDTKLPNYQEVKLVEPILDIPIQDGGKLVKKFKLSEKLIKSTLDKINKDKNYNLKLKTETIKNLKNKYEELITKALNDVIKSKKSINIILQKKKFSLLI